MNTTRIIATSFAAISLVACLPQNDSSTPDNSNTPPSSFIEDYPYQNQRIAPSSENVLNGSELRDVNHALAKGLYPTIQDGNFVIAPYEITQNIAQLALAAGGTTKNELIQTIGISADNKLLFDQVNALDQQLQGDKTDFSRYSLLIGQVKYPYITSFLDSIARYFGAVMKGVDFLAADAASQIQQAAGTVVPDAAWFYSGFTNRSRLALGNGMKQTGSGYGGLSSEAVGEIRFGTSGGEVVVPGIKFSGTIAYTENEDYQAFDLPLGQGARSLIIIMPKDDSYAVVESQINQQLFANVISALQPSTQTVYLPAFNFTTNADVRTALAGLSSSTAFLEGAANFSGVNGAGYLFLKRINQMSTMTLGTSGVGLSAHNLAELEATRDEPPSWNSSGVIMKTEPLCGGIIIDTRSRPFIFVLRDKATDTWLAVGRVTKLEGANYNPCQQQVILAQPEPVALIPLVIE